MVQGNGPTSAQQSPTLPDERLADTLASERVEAVQQAEIAALGDILVQPGAREGVEAIIAGASPDDAARLLKTFGLPKPPGAPRKPSDELADDWRQGGYPYKYKMLRRDYEQQKFALQTELLLSLIHI